MGYFYSLLTFLSIRGLGWCYTRYYMKKTYLIAGNWKMNPASPDEAKALFRSLQLVTKRLRHVSTLVFPPMLYLGTLRQTSKLMDTYHLGAQNVFSVDQGAFTGEVSAKMVSELGVKYSLVGHSERRSAGETNEQINEKLKACFENEITPVLCFGEEKRGSTKSYLNEIKKQLKGALAGINKDRLGTMIFAYEPVWAIGAKATGQCTPEQCKEVSDVVRTELAKKLGKTKAAELVILYGGSVDDKTAKGYLEDGGVQGVLLGRASLDPRVIGLILQQAEDMAKSALEAEE